MFTENRFKRFSTLLVLTLFSSTLSCQQAVFANDIPKGTKALVQIEQKYTGKKLKAGNEIEGRLVNDVNVNGKTLIKAGSDTYLFVKDASSSRLAGNGGIIQIENGYIVYGDNRYMIDYTETINGKEKEWVKVTTSAGIILFPLLLAGFIKGGQAEIPVNKVFEVEFNGYSHSLKNL